MKPSEEYTIHILPDEEFDLLPVGNPKEALGMTDPKRKVAWVRQTGVRDMDMGTISHEFDELMASTSLHEIDGIRYKGFKDVIRSVFNIVPGLGNAIFGAPKPPSRPQQPIITSAFAPKQTVAQGGTSAPLSEADFKSGLANIDKNLKQRETDIFRQSGFRGQKESENTALARALGNARTSSTSERDLFIKQQEDAKRAAGLI